MPEAATLLSIIASARLGTATFDADTLRVLPVRGKVRLCLILPGCGSALTIPLTQDGIRGIGIGGTITVNTFSRHGGQGYTLVGAPWTLGVVELTTLEGQQWTLQGGVRGPGGGPSTAAAGGLVQMVSPFSIDSGLGPQSGSAGLVVRFVPEPGMGLLLAAGIAGLWVIARGKGK